MATFTPGTVPLKPGMKSVMYSCLWWLCLNTVIQRNGGAVSSQLTSYVGHNGREDGYYQSRNGRSVHKFGKTVLQKLKEVLDGAEEIESLRRYNYKTFKKSGGFRQADKDFQAFKPTNTNSYELPHGGQGKWAEIGDNMIMLESRLDSGRATLVIKQPAKETYRILYRDNNIISPRQ